MAATPAPRRVRICQCPHCLNLFRYQRRPAGEDGDINVQICAMCFLMVDGARIESTLERPEDVAHVK